MMGRKNLPLRKWIIKVLATRISGPLNTPCWIINGLEKNASGHARYWLGNKRIFVHKLSYEAFNGKIPENKLVYHKCDIPDCVNPEHLFIGTSIDNVHDMVLKGRKASQKGELNNWAKLTNEQVTEIKFKLNTGILAKELAKDYIVSNSTISMIKHNHRWAGVV